MSPDSAANRAQLLTSAGFQTQLPTMSTRTSQMVESVNAASRLGALMLSVLIFAAMWESDSSAKPQEHGLASRLSGSQISSQSESVSHTSQQSNVSAELNTLLTTSLIDSRVSMVGLMGNVTSSGSLPTGIVPGRYRVVDSDGTVDSLFAARNDGRGRNTRFSLETLHAAARKTELRYFIRIESPAATVASAEADDV